MPVSAPVRIAFGDAQDGRIVDGVRALAEGEAEVAQPSQPEEPATTDRPPLLYPRTIWRIDAVTLLLLSLVLLPIAMGRFKLDKQVAGWLIVAYCVYLLSVLIVNARGI